MAPGAKIGIQMKRLSINEGQELHLMHFSSAPHTQCGQPGKT